MNNPCDNGLACDGVETCRADGGQAVCTDGTPVECEFPTFCSEPDAACVDPCDGADCSDEIDCTTDTCTTNEDGTTTCDNDTACDDADACTEGDACGDDGVCAGTAVECAAGEVCADGVCVCADDTACDDGDACTGTETCDVETGECVAGTPVDCDDGEFCNGFETCEPNAETGEPACVAGTNPCDEDETCIEDTDECKSGQTCELDVDCDDLDPCTVDACGDDGFCGVELIDCDDGDACAVNSCDSATGDCVAEPLCDDDDACTTDVCEAGVCTFFPNVCPEGQSCDPATGDCGGASPLQIDVLQFGDLYYPTGLFRCGAPEEEQKSSEFCPEGAGCDEFHWHSDTVAAISAVLESPDPIENSIDDPNPCRCGHGKVSEVPHLLIDIPFSDLEKYLADADLDELPAAGDCPP